MVPREIPSRTCAKCGARFPQKGHQYVCAACRVPRGPKRLVAHVTARELQVIALVRQAKSNKAIAYELCLSAGTVKEYLNRIYKKLELPNRTALALWREPEA